jgi:1-acyl-sn-glycerol-3-phosphate acyltransferase
MRTPPVIVRRMVVAPLAVVLELLFVLVSPLLALLAVLIAPVAGGSRPVRLLAIAVTFAARHAAGLIACLGLWIAGGFGARAGSPRMQRAYYGLLRWFVGGTYRSIARWARVDVRIDGSDAALEALSGRSGPAIVLSRHAGEGDSLLVLHELLCRHGRRPRLVLHEALRLDPLIDILGHRLPNRFVDPRGGDTEVEIAAMTEGVDDDGAVLIFPEGANFTEARRARGIERLEQAGRDEQAAWARELRHLSAPRPGGTLAAIAAAPHAHVVVVGHVGMPVGFAELWHRLPAKQTIELRLWLADELPDDHHERIDWLFGRWRELDDWVHAAEEPPAEEAGQLDDGVD